MPFLPPNQQRQSTTNSMITDFSVVRRRAFVELHRLCSEARSICLGGSTGSHRRSQRSVPVHFHVRRESIRLPVIVCHCRYSTNNHTSSAPLRYHPLIAITGVRGTRAPEFGVRGRYRKLYPSFCHVSEFQAAPRTLVTMETSLRASRLPLFHCRPSAVQPTRYVASSLIPARPIAIKTRKPS